MQFDDRRGGNGDRRLDRRRGGIAPVERFRLNADERAIVRVGPGKPGDIEQVHKPDFVHALAVAGQVAVHGSTDQYLHAAGGLAKAGRIYDDKIVMIGNRAGEREAQGSAVKVCDVRLVGIVCEQVVDDMDAGAFIGQQGIADAKDEGAAHANFPRFMRRGEATVCLGIPMQIKTIDDFTARCEAKGVERDVSLFMLQHEQLAAGDFVVVHVGYAIQKVTPEEAETAWDLYDEMLEKAQRIEGGGSLA